MVLAVAITSTFAYSDGPGIVAAGSSTNNAGLYWILETNETFHFQGEEYRVYKVKYDNSEMDVRIAVNQELDCNRYIAYTKDYTIFYDCSKEGFGVKRVMFAKRDSHLSFNPNVYLDQAVLTKKRRIQEDVALSLIAATLPAMRQTV
jgi:hypothetical protein